MAEPEQFEVLILGSGQGAGHAREWSHSNFKTQTFADGNTVSDFPLCASGEFYLVPSCARSGNTSAPCTPTYAEIWLSSSQSMATMTSDALMTCGFGELSNRQRLIEIALRICQRALDTA